MRLYQYFSDFNVSLTLWESPYGADSDPAGLGFDMRFCISNNFPSGADAGSQNKLWWMRGSRNLEVLRCWGEKEFPGNLLKMQVPKPYTQKILSGV